MRMELVVATKNKKKLQEIKDILAGLDLRIVSLADYPDSPRIVENGRTFKANAVKKAAKIARATGKLTLGEDSGLCVDALGGAPGIYSSRFSGKDKSDLKNNLKLLQLLDGMPLRKRKARYVCSVCGYVYDPVKGDPDSGIAPGTKFEDLPDSWVCPVCGAAKSQFEKEK